MPRGGARNRSGPQPDPKSGRSDRRSFTLTALPSEGYDKDAPEFPLTPIVLKDGDTGAFREREALVWAEAWRTPQACAWSMQSWRWPIVAEYCRLKTVVEFDPSASAALVGQLHRYRDQIGLTPAGLKENGWAIAADEVGAKREEKAAPVEEAEEPVAPVRRLRG
jgi:hypothetical protein